MNTSQISLAQLANRRPPIAWDGDYKIPWHDPEFSARMLREHLNQDHERASRPEQVIAEQVQYLQAQVFGNKGADGDCGRVLDLGCGPGLYCKLFAELGHECVGVDFSPAAIEYAAAQDAQSQYIEQDIRIADVGSGYDLVMMTYGEFNAFPQSEAKALLRKMYNAAWPNGTVVLEVYAEQAVRDTGQAPLSWRALNASVFSDLPHLWLGEHFWDEETLTAITRHIVVGDVEVGSDRLSVESYVNTLQGYRQHDYISMLQHHGFRRINLVNSLAGDPGLFFLVASL